MSSSAGSSTTGVLPNGDGNGNGNGNGSGNGTGNSNAAQHAGEVKPALIDHLRAALLALLVFASCAEGCPLVLRIQPRHLDEPIGRRELERWQERLAAAGVEMTADSLRDTTLAFSERTQALHHLALTPVRPLFDSLHISQRWALFPVADPNPWRLEVTTRRLPEDGWALLYRPSDAAVAHRVPLLSERLLYRRVRAHWNPGTSGPRARYGAFVRWLAADLARTDFIEEPAQNLAGDPGPSDGPVLAEAPDGAHQAVRPSEVRVRYLRDSIRDPESNERGDETEWFFEMRVPVRVHEPGAGSRTTSGAQKDDASLEEQR